MSDKVKGDKTGRSERVSPHKTAETLRPHSPHQPENVREFPSLAGNLALQRMLSLGMVQPSLTIGSPEDPLEREADQVARQVVQPKAKPCACGGTCDRCQSNAPLIQRRADQPTANGAGAMELTRFGGHVRIGRKESRMGKNQYSYPPEYRARIVELVRAGRTPEELSREFEPTAQSIRNWVQQADRDEGRRADGLTSPERQELGRLRRENRQLKLEREILAKATAWFARETGSVPGKGSSS